MSALTSITRRWTWLTPLFLGLAWTAWCGYDGLTGADSNDYSWNALRWSDWLSGGPKPPAAEHPPGFPLAGAVLGLAFGDPRLGARLLPILAFILGGVLLRRTLRSGQPSDGMALPWYLLLAFGASPFLLRYALVVLSDVPGLALMLLAYVLLLKARDTGGPRWYIASAAVAASAMSIRYAVLPMVLGAAAFVLSSFLRPSWRGTFGIAAAALAVCGALLVTFPPAALSHHLGNTPLQDWSLLNIFRMEHRSDDGLLIYRFPNIVYVASVAVHPGFLPIGAMLMPFFRWRDLLGFEPGLAAAMLLSYLLFAAGLPFQNDRVMLLALPFIAILLYPAFMRAWAWAESRRFRPRLLLSLLCLAQFGLFARAMWPFIRQAEMERGLAQRIIELQAHHVYTHALSPVLRNRCPEVQVTDLWYARIERFEAGALVVVNEPNLREQWQGLHPLENWNGVLAQGVDRLEERPGGWVFARVK